MFIDASRMIINPRLSSIFFITGESAISPLVMTPLLKELPDVVMITPVIIMSTPLGGGHIIFAFSGVRRPTWFPDILGNSSYPIFTKFGMQVYWVNSLYGIAFCDDSSIAN